jgi:hypothetical protein
MGSDLDGAHESEALCHALGEHLLNGTLPPDDAYWWTRIVVEEALAAVVVMCLPQSKRPDSVAA